MMTEQQAGAGGWQPWRENPAWATPRLEAKQAGQAVGLWLAALVWCGFCVPANLALLEELAAGNYPVLVVLLFDLAGLGLLAAAVRQTLAARRYGATPLQMDPHPGCIGGEVGGYFDVRLPHLAGQVFTVSLGCLHVYVTGHGKERRTHTEPLWQETRQLLGEPSPDGNTRVWFAFAPPAGSPPSAPRSDNYIDWRLHASCDVPGVDFAADWSLPVFATGQAGSGTARRRMVVAVAQEAAAVEAATGFSQTTGGAVMDFRAGRFWGQALVLIVVFGLGFGGGGVALWLYGDATMVRYIMAPVFLLAGSGTLAGGLWLLGNRLRVEVDADGLHIRRWLFGVPVARHDLRHDEIAGIGFRRDATATVGSRVTRYYALQVQLADGRHRGIGGGLAGTAQATQAAQAFANYGRLAFLGELPAAGGTP